MRLATLSLLFVLLGSVATAQSSLQEGPLSARSSLMPLSSVDEVTLPRVDNAAMQAQYSLARETEPAPLRFAEPIELSLTSALRGTWEKVDDEHVWRLVVSSPDAYSINFGFSRFHLPEGAAMWIYGAGEDAKYRPFTAADNEEHGELWTPIIPGDRAVIEVVVPDVKGGPAEHELELGQVNHAFLPILLSDQEKAELGVSKQLSGACNVDVVCPEGDGYRDIIRSVGAYTRSGVNICSGAAINNTADDRRPLFLTADHCGNNEDNAASVVVYWNYENSTCRTPGSEESGGPGDGSRDQFNSGTTFLGGSSTSDWAMLEFDDPILPTAQVYLAGWDRRDIAPESAIAIHHPRVQEKRISFENDETSLAAYLGGPGSGDTHIRTADWDLGTTEGGSSGSPLFNPNKHIVGQLHGGYAACENDEPDWYGRLHRSMELGLEEILDPGETGAETVDGVEASASLTGVLNVVQEFVPKGGVASVEVTVLNNSPDSASGVEFTSTLTAPFSLVGDLEASSGTASVDAGTITWTVDQDPSSTDTLMFDMQIDEEASEGNQMISGTLRHESIEDVAVSDNVFIYSQIPADERYTNSESMAIADSDCPSFSESEINVPNTFDFEELRLGVTINHTYRGDLRVQLTSPEGTTSSLIDRVGEGVNGTGADHLDVLVLDAGEEGAFGGGDAHDPGVPFFEIEGQPEQGEPSTATLGAMSDFLGEDPAGTWTLGVCDAVTLDTGSLERWELLFYGEDISSEPSRPTDGGLFSLEVPQPNPVVEQTTARFQVDVPQEVRLDLYDVTGRHVATFFEGDVAPDAVQTVAVDVERLPAGVYVLRLSGETTSQSQSLTVIR